MFETIAIPALRDNYIWLIKAKASPYIIIVDPGEAGPLIQRIRIEAWIPVAILVTHHHWDHTNGIAALLEHYDIPVYGSANETIPHRRKPLSEPGPLRIDELGFCVAILDVPGHTAGAISYYGHGMVFSGDTLFTGGCGRLFEGTAEQMYRSLQKFKALPKDTRLYCGHEYSCANLEFAQQLEPDNLAIQRRLQACRALRAQQRATVPATIGDELATNPFLRCEEDAVIVAAARRAGRPLDHPVEVFATLRAWKDQY